MRGRHLMDVSFGRTLEAMVVETRGHLRRTRRAELAISRIDLRS